MDGSTPQTQLQLCGLGVEAVNQILDATLEHLREHKKPGELHSEYTLFHAVWGGGERDKEVAYAAAGASIMNPSLTPQTVIDWCLEYLREHAPQVYERLHG